MIKDIWWVMILICGSFGFMIFALFIAICKTVTTMIYSLVEKKVFKKNEPDWVAEMKELEKIVPQFDIFEIKPDEPQQSNTNNNSYSKQELNSNAPLNPS